MAYTVMENWLKILGDFGAKTGRFTRKNMAKIGLLKIRIVLCFKLCQMLVFGKNFDDTRSLWSPFVVFSFNLACHE